MAEGASRRAQAVDKIRLVVALVDGDPEIARRALEPLAVVERVDVNGPEVTAAVTDGPAAVSPVALTLAEAGGGLRVREPSLRTPNSDDVFLLGDRCAHRGAGWGHRSSPPGGGVLMTTEATGRPPASDPHAGDVIARRAGFVGKVVSVATRALRQIPREPEAVIPALIIPVFFFVVNVGSLWNMWRRPPVSPTSRPSSFPVAIIFATDRGVASKRTGHRHQRRLLRPAAADSDGLSPRCCWG